MRWTTTKLFAVPFTVFMLVNTAENIVHYSIGRRSGRLELPDRKDMLRMIAAMVVFAVIQGALTAWIEER